MWVPAGWSVSRFRESQPRGYYLFHQGGIHDWAAATEPPQLAAITLHEAGAVWATL